VLNQPSLHDNFETEEGIQSCGNSFLLLGM